MAIYSDRHSVFTSNVDEARRKSKPQPTQFQKICDHLGIELILAHSPEAKGRVERLFQTLQKRWPKEFRILGENSYLRERWSQTREHPRFLFT